MHDEMADPYFLLFELIIYLQFFLCISHAMKHGTASMVRLFSGILFGLLLELATIRELNAYHYGQFLIMVFGVPLCIAVAWGNIIYSAMEYSDATNLPRWARPLLDGLLGLNIDLALDAVAIRLGFWGWGAGLSFQYYGVPYANFLAWFWVISSFSFGCRILAHHKNWISTWLAGPAGIIVGLTVVLLTNAFMAYVLPPHYHFLPAILVPMLAILFIVSQSPRFHTRSIAGLSFFVPLTTMLYILGAGLVSGIFLKNHGLLITNIGMLVILILLHWKTLRRISGAGARPIRVRH